MADIFEVFDEGVKAYYGNHARKDNPHLEGTDERIEWDKGWCEAYTYDPEERNDKVRQ